MPAKRSSLTASTLLTEGPSTVAVDVPGGVSVEVLSDTSAEVMWSSVEDPLSFTVSWSAAGSGSWSEAAVAGDARSYVVSGLRAGTGYSFRVQSRSAWSDVVDAVTSGSALAAPSLSVSNVLDRYALVSVSAPAVSGNRLFQVQIRDTRTDSPWYEVSDVPWNVVPLSAYDSSVGLKALSTGTTYAVRARMTVGEETSDWGPELRFTTSGSKGGKPSLSVVADSVTPSSVRLSWGTSTRATVTIYRWTRSASPGSLLQATRVGYSTELTGVFQDVGLTPASEYWYTVEWLRDSRTISVSNAVVVRTRE